MDIRAILVVLFCLVYIQYVELAISKCNKCPPGTFVLARCNKTAQTICAPCKDGTFSVDWSNEREECSYCRNGHCQPTMGLIRKCNGTVDNQCGCYKPNQFHHISTDSCRICKSCPPGEFPLKPCSGETICSRCRKNYFSNKTENYNTMCMGCARCRIYETMCTPTQDAVCRKNVFTITAVFTTPQRQAFVDGTPTVKTEKLTTTDLQSKKKNRIDPIVITVIVCVIVAVLIIVVVVYWRKKKGNHCSRTREFTIIEEWPVFSFGGLLLREQPGEIILGLHSMLNSEVPPNWRAVAAEIGVPHHQIQHFSTNIETATKEMLHYWGTSNEATLDRLYKALRKIGRDDACTFLEDKVELESTSVETIV